MSNIDEYAIYRKLAPALGKAEKERLRYLNDFIKAELCGIIMFLSGLIVVFLDVQIQPFRPILGCLSCLGIFIIFASGMIIEIFRAWLKNNYMPKFIECFEDIKWIAKENEMQLFSNEELEASQLFGIFNLLKVDDSFCGKFNNISFRVAETTLFADGKSFFPEFKGAIISFPCNKNVKANTIIATKFDKRIKNNPTAIFSALLLALLFILPLIFVIKTQYYLESFMILFIALPYILMPIYLLHRSHKKRAKMQTAKLEDPTFDKRFDVFCEDQVEARYLLTPTFIERFTNLNTAFGAKGAKCSFYKDSQGKDMVMFVISSRRNLFELGNLFTPLNRPEYKLISELSSILALIDYFKLDEKTML